MVTINILNNPKIPLFKEFPMINNTTKGNKISKKNEAPITPHNEKRELPPYKYVKGTITAPGGAMTINTKPLKISSSGR